MGRIFSERMFLVLTPVLMLHLLISSSSGASANSNENGVCISNSADLESKDQNMCNVFHGKTCCSASVALENLATYGEAAKECLDLFELLECSICHPHVEIQSGTLRICDRVFEACSDAYFSSDANNQVQVPCGASNSIICGKASKWESSGRVFCDAVGFTVTNDDDSVEEPFNGSKSSLEEPVMESFVKTENFAGFRDHQKRVREMIRAQQLSWVIPLLLHMLFNRLDARRLRRGMNGNGIADCLREDLTLFEFLSVAFKPIINKLCNII
ncbi:unnamed protein product [Microthlaspi erraticum]|uniref:Uncharacterized protein n=1 Tax=Microthlaspi erraticum TaxID=1685480 RepID=A0A6D2HJ04_9BRAS|nr:unnamed protein product [Microthlaspi erraticum]